MRTGFLIGRVLAGLFYLFSGLMGLFSVQTMSAYAAARGVPAPTLAVVVAHLLLLLAGLSLLSGYRPHWGVAALVIFFIPVTLWMHAFWSEPERGAQMMQMAHFTKNVGLLASSLMFLAIPRPWPYSVEELQERQRLPRQPLPVAR